MLIAVVVWSAFATAVRAQELYSADRQYTIREIVVEVRDIFDEPEKGFLYQTANDLKFSTRQWVIRRELIFKVGDVYDPFVIAESERYLRGLPFITNAKISAKFFGDQVDIYVSVQDTWTLFPQASFSSGGGGDKRSLGIVDSNVLGYGRRLEFVYAENEGREEIQGVYEDDFVLKSKKRLLVGQFVRSDGYRSVASFGQPFRSLVQDEAWIINGESFDLIDKLYEYGDERYIFRHEHLDFNGGYTVSRGTPEEELGRYTFGYDYLNDSFDEASAGDYEDVDVDRDDVSQDPGLLADDRVFSGPFFSYRNIKPDFLSLNHLDKIERVQDFNLGQEYFVKLGYAPEVLGSRDNTMFFVASASEGAHLDLASFVRGGISVGTRVNADKADNTITGVELKYYNFLGDRCFFGYRAGKHTIAANYQAFFSDNLDKDKEFLLGAFSGLRGYKDKTFSGTSYMLLNIEDRAFYIEDVLQLFSVGSALFIDVGGTSDTGLGSVVKDELYADVGAGLRLGFPRASGGSVWRLDVAFPLRSGPDGSDQFEPRLLITIGQAFNGALKTEAPEAKQAAVDVGF